MTEKIERFETLERLASANEREASQRLASQRAEIDAKERELQQLRDYLKEYQGANEQKTRHRLAGKTTGTFCPNSVSPFVNRRRSSPR